MLQPLSFDEFYRAEWLRTVRLTHLLTGRAAVAEDLAQDVFVRVRPHYARLESPAGYLRTVTVNVCRNWQRSQMRERARQLRLVEPARSCTVDHDEMLDVVDRLPFRQRTVMVLRYWLDMSEADIAACIGCRPGTVKSLNARAIAQMRKGMEP